MKGLAKRIDEALNEVQEQYVILAEKTNPEVHTQIVDVHYPRTLVKMGYKEKDIKLSFSFMQTDCSGVLEFKSYDKNITVEISPKMQKAGLKPDLQTTVLFMPKTMYDLLVATDNNPLKNFYVML